jgi:methionyl-tRNA formyltransferase
MVICKISMKKIPLVIATIRPWNILEYKKWKPPVGYSKHLISKKEELTVARLRRLNPRYIFFPHWSWIIPSEIYKNFECVIFHETDVPFGRGGSPIQNLIVQGIYRTKISTLRATKNFDAGPVYLKRPFNIKEGSAQEIFERAAPLYFEMIYEIVIKGLKASPQKGRAKVFKRRTPAESEIPGGLPSRQLYDFIRMLDADGYPNAFLTKGKYRVEFSDASVEKSTVSAKCRIIKM